MKRNWLFLACAGLTQLCAAAQNSSIDTPVLGYFWSTSQKLVAIEGITTAAATRVYPRVPVQNGHVTMPPLQGFLWIEQNGHAYVEATPSNHPTAVPDAMAPADLVSFSSDGSAAVLYSKAAGKMQVIGGLPSAPSVMREMKTPPGDIVSASAISDDGSTVLIAGNAKVYASSGGDSWGVVMDRQASFVQFIPHQSSALITIEDQNQLYLARNPAGVPDLQVLAGSEQGIQAPLAVLASDDGRLAIVLNGNRTQVIALDLNSLQAATLQLGIIAGDMQRGRDSTIFLLPRRGASPWLVDTKSDRAILSFAPELPSTDPAEPRPAAGRR